MWWVEDGGGIREGKGWSSGELRVGFAVFVGCDGWLGRGKVEELGSWWFCFTLLVGCGDWLTSLNA